MDLSKEHLEELAAEMSVSEMAVHLGIARSTLYYHMRKLGVKRRSKSEAQKMHIQKNGHQREGSTHSEAARRLISSSTQKYWDGPQGQKQRDKLSELRQQEWVKQSRKDRREKLAQLRNTPRPSAGELSKFGTEFAAFLNEQNHQIRTGISLTPSHLSDIIIDDERVVIEMVLPVSVYGKQAEQKLKNRYDKLVAELRALKYRVVIVEQVSNSISRARCQRLYDELVDFFQDSKQKTLTIES